MLETTIVNYKFGPHTIQLCEPAAPAVAQHWQANPGAQPPYWARVWPASVGLCQWLASHPQYVRNKRVMELGAGLAMPSLLAAHWAKSVFCTDVTRDILPYVEKSIALNGLQNITCGCYDWAAPLSPLPDVLLLSDVNYDPARFDALYKQLRQWWQQGAVICLSTPQRLLAKPFIEKLLPMCTQQFTEVVEQDGETAWISVLVLMRKNEG
jgi:predicted nicotinamide N-methyase